MSLSLSGCGLTLKDGTRGSAEVRDNPSSNQYLCTSAEIKGRYGVLKTSVPLAI